MNMQAHVQQEKISQKPGWIAGANKCVWPARSDNQAKATMCVSPASTHVSQRARPPGKASGRMGHQTDFQLHKAATPLRTHTLWLWPGAQCHTSLQQACSPTRASMTTHPSMAHC